MREAIGVHCNKQASMATAAAPLLGFRTSDVDSAVLREILKTCAKGDNTAFPAAGFYVRLCAGRMLFEFGRGPRVANPADVVMTMTEAQQGYHATRAYLLALADLKNALIDFEGDDESDDY